MTEPRAVFAHYMVCCPMAGSAATEKDFAEEIRQAQSHGLDGFVLNCGSWDKEPRYHAYGKLIFAAASKLSTDFKLLFSADKLPLDETVAMVTEFYDHPNMYRFRGKPVLSTFAGGEKAWTRAFLTPLAAAGKPVFFVPFFFPRDPIGRITERFTDRNLAQLIADNSFVDGFFFFGASGQGDEIAQVSKKIGQAWHSAGKLYMAPVTPYYCGLPQNNRVFESRGFEGMAAQWEAAINVGAQWVEIVTWNDWGESTYVASFGSPSTTDLWNGNWGPRLSHEAYLAASIYYIRWFKTGDRSIHEDKLFWFYRLAPHSQPGQISPNGVNAIFSPNGADKLEDRVFVTVFLTAAAQVNIASGDRQYTFTLPAGMHHLDAEFADGPQRFSMARNGRILLKGDGAFPITENNWSNFDYLSGQASHL